MSTSQKRQLQPLSIALPRELKEELAAARHEGMTVNVSQICRDAILRELERWRTGNEVVERLKVELTERRGPEWTAGYQEGMRWGETRGSWLEITHHATRHTPRNVRVKFNSVDEGLYQWLSFEGIFHPPVEDYGVDGPDQNGSPGFVTGLSDDGRPVLEYSPEKCERYWRGWLQAVTDLYAQLHSQLPSVEDQLPIVPTLEVDPEEIPF